MSYNHTKDSYFALDSSAGSLVDISSYVRSWSLPREAERADVTAIGDVDRASIPGFTGGTISLGGQMDYTTDGIFDILATLAGSVTTRTFNAGPEGGTTGDVKLSGECILTSLQITAPFDQPQTFEATLRIDGAITAGTF